MEVRLRKGPTEEDWAECKARALVTVGKGTGPAKAPSSEWRYKILRARHSPIRYLVYSFDLIGIPSNVAVHLCRHVHAQPYVQSLRNDRQTAIDGDAARRDTPIDMILDVNAEELLTIANKRLCNLAAEKTRCVVKEMCRVAAAHTPELTTLEVPNCVMMHGCNEMHSCGWYEGEYKEEGKE